MVFCGNWEARKPLKNKDVPTVPTVPTILKVFYTERDIDEGQKGKRKKEKFASEKVVGTVGTVGTGRKKSLQINGFSCPHLRPHLKGEWEP